MVRLLTVAGTPTDIVKRLNLETSKILSDPLFKTEYLDRNGLEPIGGVPEELASLIKKESERWGAVIRGANIKLD